MSEDLLLWDGDPCACALCADGNAAFCIDGEPVCLDCEMDIYVRKLEAALTEIATADDNVSGGFRFHNIARKALGMEPSK